MQRFRNILVGVDLSHADRLAVSELNPPTEEAINRAIWLASRTNARLTFFAVLDLSAHTRHLLEEDVNTLTRNVEVAARDVLNEIVERAKQQEVESQSQLVFGPGWLEIIRQVLRGNHDLVIMGTRDASGPSRLLFGSTAMKLLRKCPCPVWVTKSDPTPDDFRVLVASDLSDTAAQALQMIVEGGQLCDMRVHLLHAVDIQLSWHMAHTGLSPEECAKYRKKICREAESALQEQLAATDYRSLPRGVQVHVKEGPPDVVIPQAIEEYEIDLLVMGTLARSGIRGMLVGNTAERILPQLSCSLLAVKAAGFESPITLD